MHNKMSGLQEIEQATFGLEREEIILPVLRFLTDPKDLARLCCVCKLFNTLIPDDRLWEETCSIRWPSSVAEAEIQAHVEKAGGYKSFYSSRVRPEVEKAGRSENYVLSREIVPGGMHDYILFVDLNFMGRNIMSETVLGGSQLTYDPSRGLSSATIVSNRVVQEFSDFAASYVRRFTIPATRRKAARSEHVEFDDGIMCFLLEHGLKLSCSLLRKSDHRYASLIPENKFQGQCFSISSDGQSRKWEICYVKVFRMGQQDRVCITQNLRRRCVMTPSNGLLSLEVNITVGAVGSTDNDFGLTCLSELSQIAVEKVALNFRIKRIDEDGNPGSDEQLGMVFRDQLCWW